MTTENPDGDGKDGQRPPWRDLLNSATASLRSRIDQLSQWVNEHQEEIGQVAAGLMTIAVLQPRLAELRRRLGDSEWAYLVERLDFVNGLALMLLLGDSLDRDVEEAALDFMEEALGDSEFLTAVRARLAEAPLSIPQRKQLLAGLREIEEGEYELAVPLLMVALEGAFAGEAERRELVRRAKTKLAYAEGSGKTGNVGGAEEIFKLLGLDEDLLAFLRRQVYGDQGNAFRHGVALSGFRQKALTLTIALVAYLDLMSDEEGTLLVEAFGRQDRVEEVLASVVLSARQV